MKIKKISIHGFKSFVDKTTLEFSSGTSGIIGPNGCGKSNIVDAIRWVIGEQNPRHLRGKSMEDVIFNGSDTRKPLGMAEVVLTFSNEDGNAPARYAGFTEIEISRRLYRSGESEYYINKVQSRLRDIIDLFTDTGIGTKAYSIVEQGQVGWLVNAKPEERRAIFEEAAGINKFKHKKQAAIRRLDSTKENLTRVNDIISEVKRQLNSLNRQAKKAERYKIFRDELKEVDLTLYSMELTRLKNLFDDTSRRLLELQDEEMALSNTIATREGLLEEYRTECIEAENEFKSVRERVYDYERRIQEKERGSDLIQARLDELKRNKERVAVEIEELGEKKDHEAAEIESLKTSMTEVQGGIENETTKLNEASEKLSTLAAELRSREDALRDIKTESLGISTRLNDIKHTLQGLLKDEDNLRIREARARTEIESLKLSLESKEAPLRDLREKTSSQAIEKEAIENEISDIRTKLASFVERRSALDSEHSCAKDELAMAASRLAALEEMERNHENLRGGARSIMQKEDKNGIYGILADCFETTPGYELAVEAVLGDRLQYVIVESHAEGIEAVEYLKKRAAGRGSFVPIKDLRTAAAPVPVQPGSYIPPGAKELIREVSVKDDFGAIMHSLLGDVLVVDDLRTALELWRQNGFYRTLVTLNGEIINPQGIITGGTGEGSDSGILQKRAEMKDIRSRAAGLEDTVTKLSMELESTAEEIAASEKLLEEKKECLHSVQIDALGTESELKKHTEEAERLAERVSSLDSEITEASEKLIEVSEKKSQLVKERESLEGELSLLEEKAVRLSSEIEGLAAKKEELSGIVTEIRVTLAQARERLESLRKELESRTSTLDETIQRMEVKVSEIASGSEEAKEKEEELKGLKASIEELLSARDSLRADETRKGEALGELEERIRGVEKELKGTKDKTSELLELKGELTIEVRELDMKMTNLKERASEKYTVDITTYAPANEAEVIEEGGDTGEAEGARNTGGRGALDEPELFDAETLKARKQELTDKINSMGNVNLSALDEFEELDKRHNFLLEQQADLTESVDSLMKAIFRINRTTRERFRDSFEEINAKFKESFPRFFRGGKAELRLTEGVDILEAGIDIVAQPPGKRLQNITLLSGGEKALTATSLVFSIFLTKPSPFCLLDEVDAPLDDANIDKFNTFVREMSELSQFLVITHNKKTMEIADTLYGVTMEEPGVSKIVTLRL